ncbi:MAG: hypothetical protein MI892_04740 [Desulfobacterales bacterium]|nr:hypothetical protein [Desulfobacterales bacterium]
MATVTGEQCSISSETTVPKPQAPGLQPLPQSTRPKSQGQVSSEIKPETQPKAATADTSAGSAATAVAAADHDDIAAQASKVVAKTLTTATTANTGYGLVEEKQVAVSTREPEEKIPVYTDQTGKQGDHLDDDVPMMSATSYPGQEWNPYGNLEDYYND